MVRHQYYTTVQNHMIRITSTVMTKLSQVLEEKLYALKCVMDVFILQKKKQKKTVGNGVRLSRKTKHVY